MLILVLVHEFGHFWTAKKFGIRVDEFGFGFPPKLFGFKKGETEYTFNLLPIGGFVKIFGENPDNENINGPDKMRSFVHKPHWQQAIVLGAGIFANFLLAWLFFSIALMSGLPTSVTNNSDKYEVTNKNLIVMSVLPDSPASKSGLKSGDKIKAVSNINNELKEINPDTLKDFISSSKGQDLNIYVDRGEEKAKLISIKPELNADSLSYSIGISMDEIGIAKFGFFESIWQGFVFTCSVIWATILGFVNLISNAISGKGSFESIAGPVGMVGIVGSAYEFGFVYLLSFVAVISINLGVINLVPFPALDGGRLLFVLIEKIRGKKLNSAFANTANMVGFFILIGLMILITYHDIVKVF